MEIKSLGTEIKDLAAKIIANDSDFLIMQSSISGETYKITKADLLQGLSSSGGGSGGGNSNITQFNFASVGDTNGIIYAFGTNQNTTIFSNPADDGRIVVLSSSILNNNPFTKAFGRIPGVSHSLDAANQFVTIDFGASKKVKLNKYIIQGRNDFDGHHLRNWKIEGSNDTILWDILDTQNNNETIRQSAWFVSGNLSTANFYRYLKLTQTAVNSSGANFLTMGQMELYGALQV